MIVLFANAIARPLITLAEAWRETQQMRRRAHRLYPFLVE